MEDIKDTTQAETKEQENVEVKTYTQEEVDKLIQQAGDRRVSQAQKTWKKQQEEAEKLAAMTAEEKVDYEYKQKLSELEERESNLAKRELLAETEKQLAQKGLPSEAAAFIVAVDAETTKSNIDAFAEMFNKAVESAVTGKIGTGAPKAKTGSTGITKEEFKKMSLAAQAELYHTNKALYDELSK